MIILVNGRVVSNINVNRSIKDAYHTVLADNKYPIVVINIETDPTLVDVNIHPTKQDVKFSKMESLEDLLFNTIRSALLDSDNTKKVYEEPKRVVYDEEYTLNDNLYPEEKKIEEIRLDFDVKEDEVTYNEEEVKKENRLIKPVGLALGTYLIAQDEDIMYMMDIHAANERINYERYLNALRSDEVYVTNMLFPLTLEYPTNEFMNIKNNIDEIIKMGFQVDEFGTNTFRVSAHPNWLKQGFEDESIRRIFELVGEFKGKFDRVKFNDAVAARLACKASVKGNTSITYEEQEELIERLFKCEFPYTCPHGRPTVIKYPIHELEKMFKRVNFSKEMNDLE